MSLFFFFNDTATTEIYTLSLHDALPISTHTWGSMSPPWPSYWTEWTRHGAWRLQSVTTSAVGLNVSWVTGDARSEEHTSELQSQSNLVCRLLLEKKKMGADIIPSRRCCR